MVAREGFEPSKPLGRQIYSLLRLTASLPRRYPRRPGASGAFKRVRTRERRPDMPGATHVLHDETVRIVRRVFRAFVELAKGFEPPTG